VTGFMGITCDRCRRPLELREVAYHPDPEGDENRLLCKWCFAVIVFRQAEPLSEPELSEGSPEGVNA
jgi:hypothetical protein